MVRIKEGKNVKQTGVSDAFKKYLRIEVIVDYKACIYFFCILFFYCMYLISQYIFAASMLHMLEMIVAAYVMGYLQVCLFRNFDEAEHIGKIEMLFMFFCVLLYTGCSYLFGWFDRNLLVTGLFALFMFGSFWCMYFANKIKRAVDTEQLNIMLETYKQKGEFH